MSIWMVFVVAGLLIVLNSTAFGMLAWDEWCSQNKRRRISEASLLFAALIGGSAGAITAQQTLRHKTRKEPFRSVLWGIAAMQVAALVVLAVPAARKAVISRSGRCLIATQKPSAEVKPKRKGRCFFEIRGSLDACAMCQSLRPW